ncbi:MAG: hypothetical protein LBG80_03370 [Bacteroidales bacterium]|jgi:O-antigen/teichoic acid export membrane protein|nr:hypothetical protein [Bacteroidales bacterium]
MKQPESASKKIIMNTGILYAKMLVTMGISLYSTRVVLNALGETDYGIFSLIFGIITMLSFLNAAMTTSTQRYLSFYQGKGDVLMQNKIFVNSWVLHILTGFIVVVLLEIIVPFLFDGFLNIPEERVSTAKAVYHFMTVSVFFTIISAPFTASLNAHENMLWIAIIYILEVSFKLVIALFLFYFTHSKRLIMFGSFTTGISVISFLLYSTYCLKKYKECIIRNYRIEKSIIKELYAFTGWNLFGAFAWTGRVQGLAILLNIFYGAVINTSFGIANQISGQMTILSATLLRALNPQIMKSEGMSNRQRMLRLSMIASKFGFFLVAVIAIPCIFEMSFILKFWLKDVPEYTATFCSLFLIGLLINQLTIGLQSAIQATGKIKMYQSVISGILLFNLPVSYVLLKFNLPVYSVLVSFITIESVCCIFRLIFLQKAANLSIYEYFKKVFYKELFPISFLILSCWLISHIFIFDYRFIITGSLSAIVFAIGIYFTGLCKDEKILVNSLMIKLKITIMSIFH